MKFKILKNINFSLNEFDLVAVTFISVFSHAVCFFYIDSFFT